LCASKVKVKKQQSPEKDGESVLQAR